MGLHLAVTKSYLLDKGRSYGHKQVSSLVCYIAVSGHSRKQRMRLWPASSLWIIVYHLPPTKLFTNRWHNTNHYIMQSTSSASITLPTPSVSSTSMGWWAIIKWQHPAWLGWNRCARWINPPVFSCITFNQFHGTCWYGVHMRRCNQPSYYEMFYADVCFAS